jgi:hypothetical protein
VVGYMRDRDGDAAPIFAPRSDDPAGTHDGLTTR